MIEALLLDLDNTLVDRDAAFLGWLASLGVDPAISAFDRAATAEKPKKAATNEAPASEAKP